MTRESRKRLKFVSPKHAAIRNASRVSGGTTIRKVLQKITFLEFFEEEFNDVFGDVHG